jgi:hypothetical protein
MFTYSAALESSLKPTIIQEAGSAHNIPHFRFQKVMTLLANESLG